MKDENTPIAIWPGIEEGVPKPVMPYSPAVKVGDWVFIAGQLASDFKNGVPKNLIPEDKDPSTGLGLQSEFVLGNMATTVEAAGFNMSEDTVKIWEWFVSDRPNLDTFSQGNFSHDIDIGNYGKFFEDNFSTKPTRSTIGIKELMWVGTKVELEVMCYRSNDEVNCYSLDPNSLGSDALKKGEWVFVSNQTPVDKNGCIADSFEEQLELVISKASELLEQAGSSLENAVKAEVFISDPNDFKLMDEVWKKHFPNPPARFVLPRSGMNHSKAKVEVSFMALTNDARLKKQSIETSDAPEPFGHEPQAIQVGQLLFFSTQMAFDSSGNIAEGMVRNAAAPWYGRPAQSQMRYMMSNINSIAEKAGSSVENIVRRACFHNDLQWFAESIEEWARYFPSDKPASTTIGLNDSMVLDGANTLLDLIAFVPSED
tara:strand:+ start:867 stop:2150 length:1284 start_codon:yes stop_codon:yes gene_type:complete